MSGVVKTFASSGRIICWLFRAPDVTSQQPIFYPATGFWHLTTKGVLKNAKTILEGGKQLFSHDPGLFMTVDYFVPDFSYEKNFSLLRKTLCTLNLLFEHNWVEFTDLLFSHFFLAGSFGMIDCLSFFLINLNNLWLS